MAVKAILPGEVKTVADKDVRASTRVRSITAECGAGLVISSIAGKEFLQLTDFTGAGFFSICPGKGQDPQESPNTESQLRQTYTRQDNTVMAQTSPAPGDVLKNGQAVIGFKDLNGTGVMAYAGTDGGSLVMQANGSNGGVNGPSIFLDSKNNLIILTAGSAQFVINGPKGQTETCKQVIQEKNRINVEDPITRFKNFVKDGVSYFCKACGGGGSGSGSSGSSDSGSSSSLGCPSCGQ